MQKEDELYGIENNEEFTGTNLRDIFEVVLRNWYWFVLSVVVCVFVAVVYLKAMPKIYTRTATVLIKDNQKGGGMSESSAFEELGAFGMRSSVDNEVFVLRSKRLMEDVVRRLGLDIAYAQKNGLRTDDLYAVSPVRIVLANKDETDKFAFTVTPLSEKEFQLSAFSEGGETVQNGFFGDTLTTPVGRLQVFATSYCLPKTYGEPVLITKSALASVANVCKNAVNVALISKSATLIEISMNNENVRKAEDIINTLIFVYNEDGINDKKQIAVNTSTFIDDRLAIIAEDLGEVDRKIETYKKNNELTDIASETGIYLQRSRGYKDEGIHVENQIALAAFIKDYLTDKSKEVDLIPTNTGIEDSGIGMQITNYNELLLQREKLLRNSSENNPVVQDLTRSLLATKNSIIRSVDNWMVSLQIKYENFQKQENLIRHRINSVPTQEKDVLTVARQQKIKEELYLYLLNKWEENSLNLAITESNVRIIDPAYGSNSPVAPKPLIILMVAFVLGCAIPGAILYLKSVLDTTVRGRKDLENNTSIPFLGEVPYKEKNNKGEIVVRESSRDSISEAFRIVRSNIDFMQMGKIDQKVIMLTSTNPNAGKTFVAINMAMSFALASKKVLLIDLDIRKGTLSKYVSTVDKGITNYLSGKVEKWSEIVIRGELHPYLDVIPAGLVPPNPAELLLSDRLDKLITELRLYYDYIIIDNVPAMMVADAAIVSRVVDLTVYIIRDGVFDRRQLPELEKIFISGKFPNMSMILNGVCKRHAGYGYGYGSKYGYGYMYGYGYEEKKKKTFFSR